MKDLIKEVIREYFKPLTDLYKWLRKKLKKQED